MGEVNTALSANPEVGDYVKRLEDAFDERLEESEPENQLPHGEDVVLDVEEFLRSQREDE